MLLCFAAVPDYKYIVIIIIIIAKYLAGRLVAMPLLLGTHLTSRLPKTGQLSTHWA